METPHQRRENYSKYVMVKEDLQKELERNQTSKEIADKIGIALPTVHKYKNLVQLETGITYATRDETAFLARLRSGDSIQKPKTPKAGTAQSTSLKDIIQHGHDAVETGRKPSSNYSDAPKENTPATPSNSQAPSKGKKP